MCVLYFKNQPHKNKKNEGQYKHGRNYSTTPSRTVPTYPVTGSVGTVHGMHRDSVKCVPFTGSYIASEVINVYRNCVCVRVRACVRACVCACVRTYVCVRVYILYKNGYDYITYFAVTNI